MEPVLFFDGHCVLCHGTVGWLLRLDTERRLRFAPLAGETGQRLLPADLVDSPSSVVLWNDGRTWLRSSALIETLRMLGPGSRLMAAVLRLVPGLVRDWAYDRVARYRTQVFGRLEVCPLPPRGHAHQFLP
jgi:predicted DCC family thiol-disulfide oxidoreductase YuxK